MFAHRRVIKLAVLAFAFGLPGCALVPNVIESGPIHGSFPRQGAPFESKRDNLGRGREDTLDAIRAAGVWEFGRNKQWELDISACYLVRNGGIYAENDDKFLALVSWSYRKRVRE